MDFIAAWRGFQRTPGFAILVVLTLAAGIGATTTAFSVVWSVFLRPLPLPDPDRLVTVWRADPKSPEQRQRVSPADFVDWSRETQSFEALGVLPNWDGSPQPFNVVTPNGVERVRGMYASSGFFEVLGVQPLLGQTFTADEDRTRGARKAILSHGYWQSRFEGDRAIVGRTIEVDTFRGGAFTIVGVMPETFDLPRGSDIWLSLADWGGGPMPSPEAAERCCPWYVVLGRLRPGLTVAAAATELSTIAQRVALRHPQAGETPRVHVDPLRHTLVGDHAAAISGLSGAVICVLLIGCGNVANLMLSRALGRRREMLVRRALGATRARLARQLIAESLLLGAVGAFLGVILSLWAQDIVAARLADRVPFISDTRMDAVVLAFTIGLTLAVSTACGLLPLVDWQRTGWSHRGNTEGRASRHIRHALVVAGVALAVAVVSTTGLLVRSLVHLRGVDLGFDTSRTLIVSTDLTTEPLRARGHSAAFIEAVLGRIAPLPGVRRVAATTGVPTEGVAAAQAITREHDVPRPASTSPVVRPSAVTPDYFATMGIRTIAGRTFTGDDREDGMLVAVINEAAARRYWPGENPLGRRFALGSLERFGSFRAVQPGEIEWRTVVGIVSDVRSGGFASPIEPEIFFNFRQYPLYAPSFIVRADGDPSMLAASVRSAIHDTHPRAVITRVRTLDDVAAGTLADPTLRASLATTFSVLALLLGMLGMYGLMSYTVTQQIRGIGIRMALGATRGRVAGSLLARTAVLAAVGAGIGIAIATAVASRLSSLLFEIAPTDAPTLLGAVVLLMASALIAAAQPVRRAVNVDPAVALRDE